MLVIVLAAIVVVAGVGIFFLMRNGEPTEADRAARRKYSIRRRGVRTHPLPIGLPGSLSDKISSVFKGRRAGTGAGWMPAKDVDDDDLYSGDEWDTTDEPLRVRERGLDHHGGGTLAYEQQHHEYPRVGTAPASRQATLTEASTESGTHKSRSASHVNADDESSSPESFGRIASPVALVQAQSVLPEGEWLNARDARNGADHGGGAARALGYLTPEPRRADSGQEIPLFAGSAPFRD